jgi:hypothetical protein
MNGWYLQWWMYGWYYEPEVCYFASKEFISACVLLIGLYVKTRNCIYVELHIVQL